MSKTIVELPWPPSELSPNARGHWAKRHRAAKAYRRDCYWLSLDALGRYIDYIRGWGSVHAWIDFHPPDRRHRDDDNMVSAFKAGRDGMADALGIDDQMIRIHPMVREPRRPGAVVVTLTPGPG